MGTIIAEAMAIEIVKEFLDEIRREDDGVLALYLICSLGGGYYRPGQSDIDTVIIVSDNAAVTQKRMDEIVNYRLCEHDIRLSASVPDD